MCGIAGFIGKNDLDKARIERTLELMSRRGPDKQAWVRFEEAGRNIYLLHSRLSIIDIDHRSDQPFSIGPCTIVFNGEIYNYIEIRDELRKRGVTFQTTSDTEVLLQAYLTFGRDCVKKLEGMWAFAIYDKRDNTLFFSRDRFAEKPLYYYQTEEGFYFASEIKFIQSLIREKLKINYKHLYRYLVNGYKSLYKEQDMFFEGVKELRGAHFMVLAQDMSFVPSRYWIPKKNIQRMSIDDAISGYRERLLEAVRIRLRADVPLAFCLSGGVDSGAIVSIAAKHFNYDVHTFSIVDSDERYNELKNIQATIQDAGCKNTIIELPQNEMFGRLEKLIEYHDAPLYTITFFVHSLLIDAIKAHGYKVSVAGTGADELVTGYYDHFILHLHEMRRHPDYQKYLGAWEKNVLGYVRNQHLRNPDLYANNTEFRDHIYLNQDIFKGYLKVGFDENFKETQYCDGLLRNRMMNEMFEEAVPVALHDDDMNSMYYSIENRSPYLDSRLFDFSYSIPDEYLIKDGYAKYILRQATDGLLNDQVRLDRHKKGFNASIHSLIDLNNKANREWILDDSKIYDVVDKKKIEEMLSMKPMPNSFNKFFFSFLNSKVFMDQHG